MKVQVFEVMVYSDREILLRETILAKDEKWALMLVGSKLPEELDGYEPDELQLVVRPFAG